MHGLKETLKKILSVSNFKCSEKNIIHHKYFTFFWHEKIPREAALRYDGDQHNKEKKSMQELES